MMAFAEPLDRKGPSILGVDPWVSGNPKSGVKRQLLSEEERSRLAVIASIVRFKKGEDIYQAGDHAGAIFNIMSGVVKSYSGKGGDRIVAFLFPNDLFGLSEEGFYTNAAQALTPVTAYRMPISALRSRLSKDALLEYHVICKLCEELRQAQRHAFLLSERRADARLATFLQMLEQLQVAKDDTPNEIYVPMDRSDIGEYVGLTLAAVSRTFGGLIRRKVIKFLDRRHVKITDRAAFDRIVAHGIVRRAGRRRPRDL
ncbi:MAG: Crp/Fnr family transcriptional regulator [Xanthobacteraceae bacterium]